MILTITFFVLYSILFVISILFPIFLYWDTHGQPQCVFWQKWLRKVYLSFFGYSEKDFYQKFPCQKIALFPPKGASYSGATWREAQYLEHVFSQKLAVEQRMILLQDVFEGGSDSCPFGGNHKEATEMLSFGAEVIKSICSLHFDSLSSGEVTLLLAWLMRYFYRTLTFGSNETLSAPQILRFLLDSRIPRENAWEAFLKLTEELNGFLRSNKTKNDHPNAWLNLEEYSYYSQTVNFLRAFILDDSRMQEEIALLAYKPYPWLMSILFESPLIREEDRVASALMLNGCK